MSTGRTSDEAHEADTRTAPAWSTEAIARLRDATGCPVCASPAVAAQRCGTCGADFTDVGGELWQASRTAAEALEARQAVLDRVPMSRTDAPGTPGAPVPVAVPLDADAMVSLPRAGSSTTVQSLLAIAGAALVGIAAVVFAFLTPEISGGGGRLWVLALAAVVFALGARLLVRRRLRLSAEAVAALAAVFAALAVATVAESAAPGVNPWVVAAVGTLLVATAFCGLAVAVRVRVWASSSLVALAIVPAMFGLAAPAATGALAGWLCAAALVIALTVLTARLAPRFDGRMAGERIALSGIQFVFVLVAVGQLVRVAMESYTGLWATTAVTFAAVALVSAVSARHPGRGMWSFVAGGSGAGSVVALALAATDAGLLLWGVLATTPAAAVIGLLVVTAVFPPLRGVMRGAVLAGGLVVVLVTAFAPGLTAVVVAVIGIVGRSPLVATDAAAAALVGIAALAAGLFAQSRRAPRGPESRVFAALAASVAALGALAFVAFDGVVLPVRLAAGLAAASGIALVVTRSQRIGGSSTRPVLVVAVNALVVACAALAWRSDAPIVVTVAGLAAVGAAAVVSTTVAPAHRFLHVGAAFAYALSVLARALDLAGVAPVPLVCVVTSAAGLAAVVATFVPRVGPRAWWSVLVVTSAPFAVGVLQVVVERSGWTALSTAVIFVLALALTVTRRRGLGTALRAIVAAVLVPCLAVVAVCLGAELLAASGSPVVLPVIAVLVALVLPARPVILQALRPRIGDPDAAAAALAIEGSSLLTAAIAIGLALAREAAGLPTAALVLVILALGSAAAAMWGERRYAWWTAAAAATGALWCAGGIAGVALVEPYVLPPAAGAVVVGAVLVRRGAPGTALLSAGLALGIVPTLLLLAGVGTPAPTPWRAYGLLAASGVLVAVGLRLGRASGPRIPVLVGAIVAAAAAPVQATRWGVALDAPPAPALVPVVVCLALSLLGALAAASAGLVLRSGVAPGSGLARSRGVLVPASVYAVAGTWTAIQRDWPTIWTMWLLMLAALVAMVAIAGRMRAGGPTALPPVWVVFGLAFVTAVVAWSPRDLRVEWFSLPLGLLLLAAGTLGTRPLALSTVDAHAAPGAGIPVRRRWQDWPHGFTGSWALLGPGIVATLTASVAATYTDPRTWRAILVMVIALASILAGAVLRLAAPFLIGIVVLPIENVLAFLVQIGRGIESMPWWITLSAIGAVLLVLAVTFERRAGEGTGLTARLRDLS